MMRTMRSLPPKPPFQEKEKEEKGNAEMDIRKEADVVFVSSLHIAREEEVKRDGQIQFFETVVRGKMFLTERKNVALMNAYSGAEEDKEELGNTEQMMMVRRTTTIVPDSLMPNDDDDENLSHVPVGRTPTPKRKKRTREMMKVENTTGKKKKKKNTRRTDDDDDDDDDENEQEEEEETMVVTNTQLTTPAKAQTTRSLDVMKKSSSSHHHHHQRIRSPLMETQKNATEEEEEEDEDDKEEFKGRSLSPTAEFREAQKIAFNSTNEKKKTKEKEFKEYDDYDEEEETFDILKKKKENLVDVNAYGETIRVADTLAIDNLNNNNNITEENDDDDNKISTKKRRRAKVDFQFGDRQTEEQDFEDGKVVAVAETFTPIRETVPAPSGMHVCDDDDEEKEEKEEKEVDEKDRLLPLREIFRAKHLIDPRDASRTAPVLEVQVLRDEFFFYQQVAARTTIQTTTTTTPKTAVHHDHYLACEIDHEIRDATEISVWKIETDDCSSSRRERSGSDDSEKKMSRFSFKGTVLIGKPSARDGTNSSSSKGGGNNGGGKTMKRWAFSIAPNGLVFTSSYKKSSLLSMMDETERTHGSNDSSDSDDYSDDSDDEDTYFYGINSAERRRRFPRKSGVYVHDPVDVNEEENVHKKDSSLGPEKKSQSQKRRSSGRRRSKTLRDGFGNSMADTKKNQKTMKKQTYFELQSPGMAGKVRPRKFASAFSEEYDETVFRLAGVGAEGKCRLWTWSCENNEDFDDDDEKKMSSSSSSKKKSSKQSKSKNRTKFSTAKICAKSVTHCKDFEIPTYKSHCVSRECEITSLSFSKDGNVLACVFDKKHVVVWDASTTRVVFSYYCTEYEIERDGLRVLDNNNKMMKRGQKSTPSRPNASNSKMKKTSADATSTGGGGPIFFFGNFRKITSSSDSSSPSFSSSSSVATFACAYNKELVVGPNASWESLKANNGSDIVSAVAVCPDVFVEEEDEEDEDDEEEDEENDVKIKAATKRNTTVNVVVTNAGRLGVFEAFGHANEATNAYEGLTFTKRHAFEEEPEDDGINEGKTNESHQKRKKQQGNFLCASHGNLFAVARKLPGCVSLYAQQQQNHHH